MSAPHGSGHGHPPHPAAGSLDHGWDPPMPAKTGRSGNLHPAIGGHDVPAAPVVPIFDFDSRGGHRVGGPPPTLPARPVVRPANAEALGRQYFMPRLRHLLAWIYFLAIVAIEWGTGHSAFVAQNELYLMAQVAIVLVGVYVMCRIFINPSRYFAKAKKRKGEVGILLAAFGLVGAFVSTKLAIDAGQFSSAVHWYTHQFRAPTHWGATIVQPGSIAWIVGGLTLVYALWGFVRSK